MIRQCHTIRLYGVIAHARDTIAHAHTCTQYKHDAEATRSINKGRLASLRHHAFCEEINLIISGNACLLFVGCCHFADDIKV